MFVGAAPDPVAEDAAAVLADLLADPLAAEEPVVAALEEEPVAAALDAEPVVDPLAAETEVDPLAAEPVFVAELEATPVPLPPAVPVALH